MDIEGFTQVDEVLLDVEAVRTIFISSAQLGSARLISDCARGIYSRMHLDLQHGRLDLGVSKDVHDESARIV